MVQAREGSVSEEAWAHFTPISVGNKGPPTLTTANRQLIGHGGTGYLNLRATTRVVMPNYIVIKDPEGSSYGVGNCDDSGVGGGTGAEPEDAGGADPFYSRAAAGLRGILRPPAADSAARWAGAGQVPVQVRPGRLGPGGGDAGGDGGGDEGPRERSPPRIRFSTVETEI
jgi:hypothetical protein